MWRLATTALVGLVLAAGGCGGGDDGADPDRFTLTTPRDDVSPRDTPGGAQPKQDTPPAREGRVTRREIGVIRGWSDALRHGDVSRAVGYFAVPSRVSNGQPPVELRTRAAVRFFNESLPCGAKLEATRRVSRGFVLATFRLTERPGTGRCGDGTGHLVRTLFSIEQGRIVQWIRASDPPEPAPGQTS